MYSSGLRALPTTQLACVTAVNTTDCSTCSAEQLSSSNGCLIYSSDGYNVTKCSTLPGGNKPAVSSCYVGTFASITGTAAKTTCSPNTEFCKVMRTFFFFLFFHFPSHPHSSIQTKNNKNVTITGN